MKDEALKLASALDHWATQMDMGRKPDPKSLTRKASAELRRLQAELDATNRQVEILSDALAESRRGVAAPVQPVFELQESGWEIICDLDWIQTLPFGTKLYTAPPAAQPAVPDAFGTREGEHPQYIQGWNDCRAEMLKGMK